VEGIGAEVPDYKELGITLWTTSPQLARTYRSTKITNAFLAGDAAHSFPPTGGLGVNTGIADVQNLAWKIHAVEQGWASPVFLDTVSHERLPVARENCRQSKLNEDKIWQLAQSILQPACVPEQLLKDPGKAQEIQNLIDENREHFHTFNLQLGYAYGYPLTRSTADYQKEIVPGVRLPHYWLEKQRSRISTLDLISGFNFVLISMTHMTNSTSITVNSVPVDIFQQGRDFHDLTGAFSDLMAKHVVRAVLVRPDHHIVGPVKSIEDIEHLLSAYFSAF
jgi:2,4-dichlorophenol 6-monooxygenase